MLKRFSRDFFNIFVDSKKLENKLSILNKIYFESDFDRFIDRV